MSRRRLPEPLLFVGVLGLVVGLNYWPLLRGWVPLPIDIIFASPVFDGVREKFTLSPNHSELGDLVAGFYPVHAYAAAALKHADIALWNPHLLLGSPFLAAYQPAILYPPNLLLYTLLPTAAAWGLLFPIRMLIAAVGMALFVRALEGTRTASLVAGLSYAFSGYLLTWSGWPHSDVAAWAPWLLLALHRLRDRPSPARAGLLALAVAFPLLAGHPQTMLYVALVTVLYALLRLTAPGDGRARYLGWAVVGGLLGAGLAAAQLLPTAQWLGLISRTLDTAVGDRLPSWNVLALLSRDTRHSPNSASLNVPEAILYVGVLPLVAAALATFSRRRRETVFFALLGAGSLLAAYGIPPVYDLIEATPALGGLPGWRIDYLADLALPVLAGLGITAWQQRLRSPAPDRRRLLAWLGVLGVVAVVAGVGVVRLAGRTAPVPGPLFTYDVSWFRSPASTAVLLTLALVLLSPLVRRVPAAVLSVVAVGVVAVDLLSYGYGHIPFNPRTAAYPEPPIFQQLQQLDPGVYRVVSSGVYAKNLEQAYGEDSPSGTGYNLRVVEPLLRDFGTAFGGFAVDPRKVAQIDDRRLDLFNVRYLYASPYNGTAAPLLAHPDRFEQVLSQPGVLVFRNRTALPRAFLVAAAGVRTVPTAAAYCSLDDPGFEPTRTVLLSDPAATALPAACPATQVQFAAPRPAADPRAAAEVGTVRQLVDTARVSVEPTRPSVLVLSDAWYPGWSVRVDGQARELLRADGGFKAVRVSPGDRIVSFTYSPPVWRTGRIASVVSAFGVLALLLVGPLRRRRSRGRHHAA